MSTTIMCECPFCPLVEANTQVCDFLVKFDDRKQNFSVSGGQNLTREQNLNLIKIAIIGRDNWKLKIGEVASKDTETFRYTIEHPRRNLYKVCFHKL